MTPSPKFKLPPEADHRWVTLYVRDTHIPEGLPVARRGYTVSDDDAPRTPPAGSRTTGSRRKRPTDR
jgi:hypothetical protein